MNDTANNTKKVPRTLKSNTTRLDPVFRVGLRVIAIWNLIAIFAVCVVLFFDRSSPIYASSFADFQRSDLALILAQGNFGNPYSFHTEMASLQSQPYLPLPFLVLDIFKIKVNEFTPNLPFVQAWIVLLIAPFTYIFWKIMGKMARVDKVAVLASLVIFTVPTMYIFSTGNIQGLIQFVALISFLAVANANLENSKSFLSTFVIFATKPQYVLFNAYQAFFIRKKYSLFILSVISAVTVCIFGFYHYPTTALANFNYWKKSLNAFVNPDPAYIVHNNASIIGNFTAIETFFFPKNFGNLFTYHYRNAIILAILIIIALLLFRIWKIEAMHWIKIWLIGGIPIFLTPVSYAYNLGLLLIPLGMLFGSSAQSQEAIKIVNKSIYLKILLLLILFLLFAPKPLHVVLITGVADTNLFTMLDSFGYLLVIMLGWNLRKKIVSQN